MIEDDGKSRTVEQCGSSRLADTFRVRKNGESQGLGDGKSRVVEVAKTEGSGKPGVVECCSLRFLDYFAVSKVGTDLKVDVYQRWTSILALSSNAVHILWKWPENE